MESFVTPCAVLPPLSAPAFHSLTHRGAAKLGNLMRPVVASQSGFFSAAALPAPESPEPLLAARAGAANDMPATSMQAIAGVSTRPWKTLEPDIEPPNRFRTDFRGIIGHGCGASKSP